MMEKLQLIPKQAATSWSANEDSPTTSYGGAKCAVS